VNKDHTTNKNEVAKFMLSDFHWCLIQISGRFVTNFCSLLNSRICTLAESQAKVKQKKKRNSSFQYKKFIPSVPRVPAVSPSALHFGCPLQIQWICRCGTSTFHDFSGKKTNKPHKIFYMS